MNQSVQALTESDKQKLFWASFLALAAAGVGFVFRVMIPSMWSDAFQITMSDVGALTGAALWPIAVTMILFSLLVDKIGYKISMFFAFALQAVSVVLTYLATDVNSLWWACFCAGLGHGVVEAVINPLCASIYRDEKSKMLNILHASWPAGIVLGGVAYLLLINPDGDTTNWANVKWIFFVMLLPVLAYGVMFLLCNRFPVDERIEANVSMRDMLREFGGLGAFLASTFLVYELVGQIEGTKLFDFVMGDFKRYWDFVMGDFKLYSCLGIGAVIGIVAGFQVGSPGKLLFFVLCLIMIPLATAELATDAWIQTLMKPILGATYAGWAIVLSAAIMMTLRFFAGIPLKFMSPPVLLLVSSIFSILGLYAMSSVSGAMIFGAFVLYAIGQTFYWPTMLGLVSEQFPKGGAMTLNTVSAMGLLTVGIFGFPFLGAVQDHYTTQTVVAQEAEMLEKVKTNEMTFTDNTNPETPEEKAIFESKNFFGVNYDSVNSGEFAKLLTEDRQKNLDAQLKTTSQSSLKVAAVLPLIMAIAFVLIIIYFAATGGYKPVILGQSDSGH